MEISFHISEFGSHEIRCTICGKPMRLVGIEPHPKIPDLVDLVTYQCECGEITASPHFSDLAIEACPAASVTNTPAAHSPDDEIERALPEKLKS